MGPDVDGLTRLGSGPYGWVVADVGPRPHVHHFREFHHVEAHLSAEQSASCEEARLPAADAHAGGQVHRELPSFARPRQVDGLTDSAMLPRRHRLVNGREFAATIRSGRRFRSGSLVGHLTSAGGTAPPRIGLVVSKRVGNSVTRHRVSRVLRHAVRDCIDTLPAGSVLVLRALPGAGERDSALPGAVRDIVTRARVDQ